MTESARDMRGQPPDAKPVALVSITDAGWVQFFVHGIYIQSGYGEEEFKRLTALAEKVVEAAAPQPPAGKGEPVAFMADVAKDFLNDCTQSKKLAEEWQQSGLCVIPLYEAPPDAVPREIHERLIAVLKADHAQEYEQHCQQAADDARKIAEQAAEIERMQQWELTCAMERAELVRRAEAAERALAEDAALAQQPEPNMNIDEACADGNAEAAARRQSLDWIDLVIRDICEIPYRSSPDDCPNMMLVTPEELRQFIEDRALPSTAALAENAGQIKAQALREAYEDLWNTEPADRMERLEQLASEHEGGK